MKIVDMDVIEAMSKCGGARLESEHDPFADERLGHGRKMPKDRGPKEPPVKRPAKCGGYQTEPDILYFPDMDTEKR